MDAHLLLNPALVRLDEALWDLSGVNASDAEGIRREALKLLPDDLSQRLTLLLERAHTLGTRQDADPQEVGTLIFDLGQFHAEVEALSHAQAEIESALFGSASVSPQPLEGKQPEQIRKFLALRDQLFRKVADFTLKLLLGIFALLVVLLLLGLI